MENLFTVTEKTKNENTVINDVKESISNKIKKVTIGNFRNIEYKEYNLNSNSLLLQGNNGIGKTNVLEAVFWALSGYLFNGATKTDKQEIKPYNAEKDVVISVKIEFENNSFTFERKVSQKWSRDKETFKGFDTSILINGATTKNQTVAINKLLEFLGLKDIKNRFATNTLLSGINIFDLFYNTNTFKNLDYKEIRAIIIDMVGEVSPKDIVANNYEKYKELKEPFKEHGYDLEAFKTNTRSKIFDKTNGLKTQVIQKTAIIKSFDEKSKITIDKEALDGAKKEAEKIEKELSELKEKINTSSNDLIKEIDNTVTLKQNRIYKIKENIRTKFEEKMRLFRENSIIKDIDLKETSLRELKDSRIELNDEISTLNRDKSNIEFNKEQKQRELDRLNDRLTELKVEWKTIKNPDTKEIYTCPYCNKEFDIAQTKEYTLRIQPKLETINKKGKATTKEVKELKAKIETLNIDLSVVIEKISKLQENRNDLDKKIDTLSLEIIELKENNNVEPPILNMNDSEIEKLEKEIQEEQKNKNTLKEQREEYIKGLNNRMFDLNERLDILKDTIDLETAAKRYKNDADEERKNLTKINKELQKQETLLALIKELEKETYEKLDEKVKDIFGGNIKFKLWKLNVSNGEYDTRLCEIYVKDIKDRFVNIKTINTGMFFVRMIEIISKIKEYYKIPKSFIFIDELSSLDQKHKEELKNYGEQIFATQVSESQTIIEEKF